MFENYDVIWCELCKCREQDDHEQEFCFFVVASGMDRAMLIAGDLKKKIEKDTGRFLIMEEDKHPECTYISRTHYGCSPYPKAGRERILHAGLVNLEATRIVSYTEIKRRQTSPLTAPLMTINHPNERRNTVQSLLGTKTPTPSPRSSPTRSPSPSRTTSPNAPKGTSLQNMTRAHHNEHAIPGSTSDPTAEYTGKTLAVFDQGRRSDGAYLNISDSAKSLSNWKNKRPSEAQFNSLERRRGNKLSLADLHDDRAAVAKVAATQNREKYFPSKDSGIGTSADLVLDQDGRVTSPFHSPNQSPSPHSKGRKISQPVGYDHLGPRSPRSPTDRKVSYDHLEDMTSVRNTRPPVPPRSGVSLGDPYVDDA